MQAREKVTFNLPRKVMFSHLASEGEAGKHKKWALQRQGVEPGLGPVCTVERGVSTELFDTQQCTDATQESSVYSGPLAASSRAGDIVQRDNHSSVG